MSLVEYSPVFWGFQGLLSSPFHSTDTSLDWSDGTSFLGENPNHKKACVLEREKAPTERLVTHDALDISTVALRLRSQSVYLFATIYIGANETTIRNVKHFTGSIVEP
jgi:hypothetical protein